VLEAAGKSFCSGTDPAYLEERLDAEAAGEVLSFARRGHELLQRIASCPKTVIARLDGSTLGAGCELALCCDLVVASERTQLGLPQIHQGLAPYLGGTRRLAERTGPGLARYLIYTGATVDAAEALEIGLVDEVVSAAELADRIRSLARQLTTATRSPRSFEWDDLEEVFEVHPVEELRALEPPAAPPNVAAALQAVRAAPLEGLRRAEDCLTAGSDEAGFAAELEHLQALLGTPEVRQRLRAAREPRPGADHP
jgi:enoyl-CoA hydratase/carnithine racemase